MKLLLAEDDVRLGPAMAHMLRKKTGGIVDWVTSGSSAFDYATSTIYDVVILRLDDVRWRWLRYMCEAP